MPTTPVFDVHIDTVGVCIIYDAYNFFSMATVGNRFVFRLRLYYDNLSCLLLVICTETQNRILFKGNTAFF